MEHLSKLIADAIDQFGGDAHGQVEFFLSSPTAGPTELTPVPGPGPAHYPTPETWAKYNSALVAAFGKGMRPYPPSECPCDGPYGCHGKGRVLCTMGDTVYFQDCPNCKRAGRGAAAGASA